jgi:hypothetical protein
MRPGTRNSELGTRNSERGTRNSERGSSRYRRALVGLRDESEHQGMRESQCRPVLLPTHAVRSACSAFRNPSSAIRGEPEIKAACTKAVAVRAKGPEAKELADQYFLETLVLLHRAGEGGPIGLYGAVRPDMSQSAPGCAPGELSTATSDPAEVKTCHTHQRGALCV